MKNCENCSLEHNGLYGSGRFCCTKCARSFSTKLKRHIINEKVSLSLKSVYAITPKKNIKRNQSKPSPETTLKRILSRGHTPIDQKPFTVCAICSKQTNSKTRKTCSTECYFSLLKQRSTANPRCGGAKHTHRTAIFNINNDKFTAESSYEVTLSQTLNDLNILWIRPSFLWYTDSKGIKRRYYPDFFLPQYNIYFDPKNDYLISKDVDKIYRTAEENNVSIYILSKNFLDKESIRKLVGDEGNAPSYSACKAGVLLLN